MAANSSRFRGALLASTSLIAAGVGGPLLGALPASGQVILPTNGVVTSGAASIRQSGADLSVLQSSPRVIVNWGSFSIGSANGVTFDQPGVSSAILNRVTGSATSTIAGQLQANGQVYLVNPNGIEITKTGVVRAGGGFVASTLGIANNDFNKGNLNFVGNGASAGVANAGSIQAAPGGFVGLLGGTVSNSGVVSVPLGKVAMGSGEQATLNLTGDNFLQVAVPTNTKTANGQALVDVSGKVSAAGGSVQLKAATVAQAIRNAVNVPGELSVSSAHASGGSIILSGGPGGDVAVSGKLAASALGKGGTIAVSGHNAKLNHATLAASSAGGQGGSVTVTATNAVSLASTAVDASGATGGGAIRIGGDFHGARDVQSAQTTTIDSASTLNASATASGDGGTVAVWSDATTSFAGQIMASGGPAGGNGGNAEVSANPATHGVLTFSGGADLTAGKGTTGTLLLDPSDLVFPGPLFLTANLVADAPGGTVTFQGTVDTSFSSSCNGGCDLTVSASTINFGGALGGINQLGAVSLTSTSGTMFLPSISANRNITLNGLAELTGDITSSGGGILFANAVTLGADATINSGAGTTTFASTVDGDHLLTVRGGVVDFDANVGSVTPLGALSVTGPTTLAGNVTTSGGAITFNNAVTLGANATINSGAETTTFASTVDGDHILTVSGGTVTFGSDVGTATPLGALSVTGPTTLAGNVATSGGAITFNNAVTLDASDVVVNAGAGTIKFGGTVDSGPTGDTTCGAGCDLTVSGGTVTFGADVGSVTPLGALTVTGPTTLAGNVTTSGGGVTFNSPVQVEGNVSVNAGAGTAAFGGTVDSALAFPASSLSVTASSIGFGGAWGGTNPLGAVSLTSTSGTMFLPSISATSDITLNGSTELTGNITSSGGNILFANAVTLQSNVTLDAPNGAVTFDSTVDTGVSAPCGAACDLTVSASSISLGGTLGGASSLGAVVLTSTSGMTLPSITASALTATSTVGGIALTGPVSVAGTVALNAAGDVVQQPGATIDPIDLTIVSSGGSITLTASVAASGNVTLSAANDIIETTAGSLSAPTLTATSTAGKVVMTSLNSVAGVSGSAQHGFSFTDNGDFSVGGSGITTTTGSVYLAAEGDGFGTITQTGPIVGPSLFSVALTDVRLNGAVNSVGTVSGNSGVEFDFKNATPTLTVGSVAYYTSSSNATPQLLISPAGISGNDFDSNCCANVVVSTVGNLVLSAGSNINNGTSSTPFGNVVLAATGNFTNDAGPTAVSAPNGNWQIYSASPFSDVFGGLNSNQTAVWDTTFSGTVTSTSVNRYLFAFQPAITVTSGNLTKTYGQDVTSLVAADYTISGLQPPDPSGAYLGDTASAVYSGIPSITSLGSSARASVTGSPYPITVAPGAFAVMDGYALALDSAGKLTIDPLALTYAVANATSTYGTTATLGAATLFGVLLGDTVIPTVGAFSGTTPVTLTPRTPVGVYSEEVTALSNPDYTIAPSGNAPGTLTIDPLALTYAVANATSTYGTTATLGATTLFGVLSGDTVVPTVGAFLGTAPVALGPRTAAGVYSEEVTALSNPNYTISLSGNAPGTLTIDPLALTYSVANANSFFGTTPILGPATLFGVLPGDVVDPTVGAFRGLAQVALTPFTPVGQYTQLVTAISNPNYRIAPAPNFPGVLTVSAATANPGAPSDPGFLPGLTMINNPAGGGYDVGGFDQVLPRFTENCNEPPSLPDPNRYSDPDQALRAISQSLENYFKHCQNPTQTTIADALDTYAAKLQVLAPRLPPALRDVPTIIADGARRVRAARSRSEAMAVLHETIAAVHKEIALVLSEDAGTRSRELRDGDVIDGALGATSVALVNSGGL